MQNILLFSCLPCTKAYTFILWTSLVCWPDRLCSTITHTLSHFRIFFDWTSQVTQLLLIAVLAGTQWKVAFTIGEHSASQFMVNKTADFKHCYLCHDYIVIFLNFEHVYNQTRLWIQVEYLAKFVVARLGNHCTEFTCLIEIFSYPGQAGNR